MIGKATQKEVNEEYLNFEASERPKRKFNYRTALIVSSIFTMSGMLLDLWIYPEYFLCFFALRIITCAGLFAAWYSLKKVRSHKIQNFCGHCAAFFPSLCATLMMFISDGGSSIYYGGIILVLTGSSLILQWGNRDSFINSLGCVILYLILLVSENFSKPEGFVHLFYITVTAIFASVGIYFNNRLRYKEYLLLNELEQRKVELEKKNLKMIELDEVKTNFFANISHELRTPLTLIIGPIESLSQKTKSLNNPEVNEYIQLMKSNGLRLLRLINDMLDLVKMDSSEKSSIMMPTAVGLFCENIVKSVRLIAEKKRINVNFTGCPELNAYIDRRALEKIILNLMMNAVKFTPAGGKINVHLDYDQDGIYLEINDTGQGMSEKEILMVFERFWQADMSAKRKHGGAGLGLALVKKLIEEMQGTIEVDSKEDEGTSFKIFIPTKLCPEEELSYEESSVEDVVEELNTKARLMNREVSEALSPSTNIEFYDRESKKNKKYTVLIVDDEKDMRSFISAELNDYKIITAQDGQEGWEKAKQYLPDLIVLDMMMPRKDGFEVTSLLRSHPSTQRIPIVLVTAKADEINKLEALNLGVNDFLNKPFSTAELHTRVDNLIKSYQFELELKENNMHLERALETIREQEATVIQAEKVSSLSVMSAGIVHEVNNPLNYVKTAIYSLRTFEDEVVEEERAEFMDTIADATEGVDRVVRIITDLRGLTNGDVSSSFTEFPAKKIYETASKLSGDKLTNTKLITNIDENIVIFGNELQLSQVLSNLMINASMATKGLDREGVVKIEISNADDGEISINITDNGIGISQDDITKIFDPFFTKRDVGEGMGLGLSICQKIITTHNGSISCESEVEKYTTFNITLPESIKND